MDTLKKYRIPFDHEYTATLGKAVYMFSYYEWIIIYIIDSLDKGFVEEYSRAKNPLTSRRVFNNLQKAIEKFDFSAFPISKEEFEHCQIKFDKLIHKRNALIHAHPITSDNGEQILAYQSNPSKLISDMQWQISDIKEFIAEIEDAAIEASSIMDSMRQ